MDQQYWIKPIYSDAQRLNAIWYECYVLQGQSTPQFPYPPDTTQYSYNDPAEEAFTVTDDMVSSQTNPDIAPDDQAFITTQLSFMKNYAEAVLAGWLNSTIPG